MVIAVLLDNPFTNDRRVLREVTALSSAGYTVNVFCVRLPGLPEKEEKEAYTVYRIFNQDIYDIKKERSVIKYMPAILAVQPDVLHCHDQSMLHLGALIKQKHPSLFLLYDSHELFHAWPLNLSKQGDTMLFLKSWMVRHYQVFREKRNARYIDRLITVNQSLADNLRHYFRLRSDPVVLRNIPERKDYISDKTLLRKKFDLGENQKILVFIGSAIYPKTLNLEQLIAETADISDLTVIIISGEQGGKEEMIQWVKERGFKHVYFHPLLNPDEIGPVLASCDVGLVPTWNRKDLSYWFALDNKLFEYMMSGIPVLATRQPEYLAIVEKFGIGVCVDPDSPGAYAEGILDVLRRYDSFAKPIRQAKDTLNWENEKQELIRLYREIPIN